MGGLSVVPLGLSARLRLRIHFPVSQCLVVTQAGHLPVLVGHLSRFNGGRRILARVVSRVDKMARPFTVRKENVRDVWRSALKNMGAQVMVIHVGPNSLRKG